MLQTVTTYPQAITRIERDGHLFDVGQIAPSVLTQLYAAQRLSQIKVSRDSWPIRGCGPESGEQIIVFELTSNPQSS